MNFIKTSLIAIVMASSLQASGIPSWFYPSAWILAAKRIYHSKKHPEQMKQARKKLEELQQANLELDNFTKKYARISPEFTILETAFQIELTHRILTAKYDLNMEFLRAQQKWNLGPLVYSLVNADTVKNNLKNALEKAEQEAYVSPHNRPKSWYEQLKENEKQLPRSERNKTAHQRAAEFKAWQQKDSRSFRNKFPAN